MDIVIYANKMCSLKKRLLLLISFLKFLGLLSVSRLKKIL